MGEKNLKMSDFELGSELGNITNKEDERVFIEKANAKAALAIIAAKKAKKDSGVNKDLQSYVDKVRQAIKEDKIPDEVFEEHFDNRIEALNQRVKKLLNRKNQNKGFLAKSDQKYLDDLQAAIAEIKKEKEQWLKNEKKGKNKNDKQDEVIETSNTDSL